MSLQRYALSCVFYASCTYDFHPQTLPSMMQLKRMLVCNSFSRVALSWSLSRCNLNSPVFSLAMRVLTFSTTLVTSELEVVNRPVSSIRERPLIFWCAPCNLQGNLVSQPHEALVPSLSRLALQPYTLQVIVFA
jgi:hypothetical protein